MINYKRLMSLNPTEYENFTNSKGQQIFFYENPQWGDMAEVICVSHELKLAANSGFFETDDMIASHGEYEPIFLNGKFQIGE